MTLFFYGGIKMKFNEFEMLVEDTNLMIQDIFNDKFDNEEICECAVESVSDAAELFKYILVERMKEEAII